MLIARDNLISNQNSKFANFRIRQLRDFHNWCGKHGVWDGN